LGKEAKPNTNELAELAMKAPSLIIIYGEIINKEIQ
jgi:hypothetical protein